MDQRLLREINQMHAQICEGLSDPKRIAILYALREGPIMVNQLAEKLNLPQATVSRHLKVLRERSLVTANRDGMNVYYALKSDKILKALDLLREVLNDNLTKHARLVAALG